MKKIASMVCAALTLAFCAGSARAQEKKPPEPPKASAGIAAEFLAQWNHTEKKLVDMAKDFPEDKFDYKAKPEQRTFAQQLLHVAGSNYYFITAMTGTKPPADAEDPSRDKYKTRAQVVEYIEDSYEAGAKLIEKQGDKGFLETSKSPFGNRLETNAAIWSDAIAHANDHYGQCVVYYRLNGMVPPESRKRM